MKVLSKILWAIDFDENHSISIEKIRRIAGQFENEIILLHVLSNDLKESEFQKLVEKSVRSEMDKVSQRLNSSGDYKIQTKIVYGSITDTILDVAEEEDVNTIFMNRGRKSRGKVTLLGLNAQKVLRNSRRPVAIISEEAPGKSNHIVCPVDGSEPSSIALSSAIIHAKKTRARLSIISVYEPVSLSSPRLRSLGLDEEHENKFHFNNFQKEIMGFLGKFDFTGIEFQTQFLTGTPHLEIIRFSKNADIIYMGSTGKTGLRRAILGSVTEKVLGGVSSNAVLSKSVEVFKLRIPTDLEDIDTHFKRAKELLDLGFTAEAIEQYKTCLQVNDLHLPSIYALASLYEKSGDENQAKYYQDLTRIIISRMTNRKIEVEIRRHYRSIG